MRVEAAGHPREEAADREGQELVGGDVDPERLREIVCQPDAPPRQAQAAPLEPPEHEERDHRQPHRQVVLARLRHERHAQEVRLRDAGEPAVAPGQRHPDRGDEADHLDERHRDHREVHAPKPERRIADDETDDGGQQGAGQQRQLERQRVVLGQERGGVGAHAHERRVPDVELAAIEGRAQAGREDDVDEHQREDVDVVVAEQRHQQRQRGQDDHDDRATHDRRAHWA